MSGSKQKSAPLRLVVFGATGHLGRDLIEQLDASDWPIAEIVGVATPASVGEEIEFRGDDVEITGEWPALKGRDLVFICTPATPALEVVREALRAEVPCIDCTGVLAGQGGVLMPALGPGFKPPSEEDRASLQQAPLLCLPSSTALAWAPLIACFGPTLERVVGTVVSSAAAYGRRGVVSLSEESIALFNQGGEQPAGPAGQPVAFDVIPGGGINSARVRSDLARIFSEDLRVDVASIQVPAFVGEGTSLALEFREPISREAVLEKLDACEGIDWVPDGEGASGAGDGEGGVPRGPTLREAAGAEGVLVGRLEPDLSLPEGRGWRLFLAGDPLRLAADHALRVGALRLGLA
jgi:aspartate-semialdehyde dehydrogenase